MSELSIDDLVKVLSQHVTDWVAWSVKPQHERDKGYTDDYKYQADEPFDQKLNHIIAPYSLVEVTIG